MTRKTRAPPTVLPEEALPLFFLRRGIWSWGRLWLQEKARTGRV